LRKEILGSNRVQVVALLTFYDERFNSRRDEWKGSTVLEVLLLHEDCYGWKCRGHDLVSTNCAA